MTTNQRHLVHVLIAIGALILAMTAATPTFGKSGHALTVQAVAVRGGEIAITVANPTGKTQSGVVSTQVPTNRGPVRVTAPVTVPAGRSLTIRVVVPLRAPDEFPMGVVVDDGVPF